MKNYSARYEYEYQRAWSTALPWETAIEGWQHDDVDAGLFEGIESHWREVGPKKSPYSIPAFIQAEQRKERVGLAGLMEANPAFDKGVIAPSRPVRGWHRGDNLKLRCKSKTGVQIGDLVWIYDGAVWPRPRGYGSTTAIALESAAAGEEVTVNYRGDTLESLSRGAMNK